MNPFKCGPNPCAWKCREAPPFVYGCNACIGIRAPKVYRITFPTIGDGPSGRCYFSDLTVDTPPFDELAGGDCRWTFEDDQTTIIYTVDLYWIAASPQTALTVVATITTGLGATLDYMDWTLLVDNDPVEDRVDCFDAPWIVPFNSQGASTNCGTVSDPVTVALP